MDLLFFGAAFLVFLLSYRPLREAASYRFRKTGPVIEGLAYVFMAIIALYQNSWWPLVVAGIVAVISYRRRNAST